jgi:hypothetical protein
LDVVIVSFGFISTMVVVIKLMTVVIVVGKTAVSIEEWAFGCHQSAALQPFKAVGLLHLQPRLQGLRT